MKTLNQRPVLDKGWVALHSASLNHEDFSHILKSHFRGVIDSRILDMTYAMLSIRCPLFVQLTFSEHGLSYSADRSSSVVEAYIPNVAEVNAPDLETSTLIQKDIEQTTEALILNPKAYQSDNCDIFISQVISPINIYNTLIVHGTLTQWMRYIEQRSLPRPVEAYRKAIEECLQGEWSQVIQMMREKDAAKKR
jgi:hypothetical protein